MVRAEAIGSQVDSENCIGFKRCHFETEMSLNIAVPDLMAGVRYCTLRSGRQIGLSRHPFKVESAGSSPVQSIMPLSSRGLGH